MGDSVTVSIYIGTCNTIWTNNFFPAHSVSPDILESVYPECNPTGNFNVTLMHTNIQCILKYYVVIQGEECTPFVIFLP